MDAAGGASWGLLEGPGALWKVYGGLLEATWGSETPAGSIVGALEVVLEASWKCLGSSRSRLRGVLEALVYLLEASEAFRRGFWRFCCII